MGCCGSKRAELASLGRTQTATVDPEVVLPVARAPRVFEYTGQTGCTIRGASSGTSYRFTRPGERIEVAYEDAFAMYGEPEVVAVRTREER